jgi:peptidoglycan/LPS O-acetylase OafA/YrhL
VIFTALIIIIYESFAWESKPTKWNYTIGDTLNIKKILEILGHLSFSVYMWHLFIIYQFGGFITTDNFGQLTALQFAVFQKVITVLAIMTISFCSYHTLEKIKLFGNSKNQ